MIVTKEQSRTTEVLEKLQNQLNATMDHEKRLANIENKLDRHIAEDVYTQTNIAEVKALLKIRLEDRGSVK